MTDTPKIEAPGAGSAGPLARTHAEAAVQLRRPFAPGAVGFRPMSKVPYNGVAYAGAEIAIYLSAQSIIQRLNAVVPGRWRMEFFEVPAALCYRADEHGRAVPFADKLYLGCRLTITLPHEEGGEPVAAVYEDVGAVAANTYEGLKGLYSDARKRVAVAAGIGAYLYTSLAKVVLPIGPHVEQVQAIGQGRKTQLVLSPETEQWLRRGYDQRMRTDVVVADLGEMLSHGEPADASGQGDLAEGDQPANAADLEQIAEPETAAPAVAAANGTGSGHVPFDLGQFGAGGEG